ncbi:MAG: glycosyltransferase [Chlorobiaceae bacterium]|jgi:glycosyltransferase involved in cell wall biosynthesis|nr:glycosyltransferase [Chlorobiaceae bacterium]NTV16043.1 glycosyltransferase [Chlorobiaceae bacterium]
MNKSTQNSVVSAIIAVYNPDLFFLEKAVASVLSQTIPVLELILVNDGGSESFRRILQDDPRIRVFSKQNEGVAAARNFALQQCRGEYIAFLDQDDYWYPDKLKEQMAMIPVSGEPCMVTSPVDIVNHQDVLIQKKIKHVQKIYFLKAFQEKALLHLAEENFIYSSTPLVHQAVFKRIGGFDSYTQPHDDWDMYLRVALAGFPIYFYCHRALSVWRSHESNESYNIHGMLHSKCRVEKKLLPSVTDPSVRKILQTSLHIDYLQRDQLLYKAYHYSYFRKLIFPHLRVLVKEYAVNRGMSKELDNLLKTRIRKIVYKSLRRYLLSFYYQAMS